ncbi:hypothetical protein ACWEKT_26225 [Nocardia takedensis]
MIMAAAVAAASAVSTGVVAGLTETAQQAVGEAYRKVKAVLGRRYPSVDVEVVESRPQAPARQAVLTAELVEAGAGEDPELGAAVAELWRVIEQHSPTAAQLVGVQLRRVRAGELEISAVKAAGASGVVAEDVTVAGKFSISDVQVSRELPDPR